MKEEFIKKYVKLCSMLDDYNKLGVKRHNRAMNELSKLYYQLNDDKVMAEEILITLLDFEDERIKATAAAHCLGLSINLAKAEKTLKNISQKSKEPLARFSAEMILKTWKEQGYLKF
jgi:hypothetical protein